MESWGRARSHENGLLVSGFTSSRTAHAGTRVNTRTESRENPRHVCRDTGTRSARAVSRAVKASIVSEPNQEASEANIRLKDFAYLIISLNATYVIYNNIS